MTVFFCDLDNTLIYSQRHDIGEQKRCVEIYQDREISFMTQTSLDLLARVREALLFVPTTTRSPLQYHRVQLAGAAPAYALVCNGGLLLRDGVIDDAWYQQSLLQIAPFTRELARAQHLLRDDVDRSFELRFLNELFLFTKSAKPEETKARLCAQLDSTQLSIFSQGDKIYVLPASLSKEHALRRLQQQLGATHTIAAGDSPMDVGMLAAADQAFAPQSLAQSSPLGEKVSIIPETSIFSDVFLRSILELSNADCRETP